VLSYVCPCVCIRLARPSFADVCSLLACEQVRDRMPAGHGLRSRTRDTFSRPFRGKGYINLSTYLRNYKIGDYVDIKVNSAVHKVCSTVLLVKFRMAFCCLSLSGLGA
jgi:Ribosomal protein L21e